jgi:hypothetical protein
MLRRDLDFLLNPFIVFLIILSYTQGRAQDFDNEYSNFRKNPKHFFRNGGSTPASASE